MFKNIFILFMLISSQQALSYERDIKLGTIGNIKIMVSCPSNYNSGEINSRSIIENFYILGEDEGKRQKVSGCQFLQAYPLFVEKGELRIWKKWIDGSSNDELRYEEMRKHGSILLGKLDSNALPSCDGANSPWFHFIDVTANSNLKVVEKIRRKNKRYVHNMKISDGKSSVNTVGWITQKKRASAQAERFCYYKQSK